jgi:hypothetical protein
VRSHSFLSTQSVRAWLDPNLPKGQLAQALCVHLTEIKAGFQAHEINDKAKGLFLSLNDAF